MAEVKSEATLKDLVQASKRLSSYVFSKWYIIVSTVIIFGVTGILYAWFQKPIYTAEITFAPENESKSALSYAGIAAQFGFDLSGGSGNTFAGENLMHLIRSRRLIEMTLLTSVEADGKNDLLINFYIKKHEINKGWDKDKKYEQVIFKSEEQPYNRVRDSVFKKIAKDVGEGLFIDKIEKKSDIIVVKYSDEGETFAKLFVEGLVENVIDYYTDYKIKKARQNVDILQRQTDSVKRLISGTIMDIAVSGDLNVNPIRQISRTGVQRKQVDAQVNGALYTELVKNLELSKLTLRKETPLIQIIDTPMYPLEKKKLGRLKGGILFGFLGAFFCLTYLILKKLLSTVS